MSFFKKSDGTDAAEKATGTVESGGNSVIPDNTTCLAMITECAWYTDAARDDTYISATWTMAKPAEYANRKVFHKIRVMDSDSKKRDKALDMLAAIDKNASGKLAANGTEPTNADFIHLMNKPMLVKVNVWEMNDRTGNWISKVSPRTANALAPTQPVAAPAADIAGIDDIPF